MLAKPPAAMSRDRGGMRMVCNSEFILGSFI